MSRIRTIKPDFFLNDQLAELPPLDRLLFIGLWTQADREGRLEDRPRKIKAAILPYDDHDVDAALTRLQEKTFIIRYAANGDNYLQIITFSKHQYPNIKEQASTIPAPCKNGTSTPRLRKGKERNCLKEGKGKEGNNIADSSASLFEEIINDLNEKSGKSFKATEDVKKLIKSRIKDGFIKEDFFTVHDNMSAKWRGDEKMDQYLRPLTLYTAKFQGYLNLNKNKPIPASVRGAMDWVIKKEMEDNDDKGGC